MNRFLMPLLQKSSKSLLLLGPRQVGKTTLLRALSPNLTINLAKESEYLDFNARPNELEERIAQTKPAIVFIDEIQRIPSLLNTIQSIIDEKQHHTPQFLLSGSSARKLKRGSANLLPGRVLSYRLGPLSCIELDYKMDSMKALSLGTLPEPYFMADSQIAHKLLESYTGNYLKEEILAESLVREIQGFSRFLVNVAEKSGLPLDFSKLAARAKVNRSAARRYYQILLDTLIADECIAYPSDAVDLVKHPYFYLFDGGVLNGVLGNFEVSADRIGHLYEHLFFNQLKNAGYILDQTVQIFSFRTRGGFEVDFLVKTKKGFFAIELKTNSPDSSEVNRLKNIDHYHLKLDGIFVATLKDKPRKVGKIQILPWQEVIREILG